MNEITLGDTLICINSEPLKGNTIAPPLEKGKEYKLQEIFHCKCGQSHFDVGLKSVYNFVTCYKCGAVLPYTEDVTPPLDRKIHWCHPTRFDV